MKKFLNVISFVFLSTTLLLGSVSPVFAQVGNSSVHSASVSAQIQTLMSVLIQLQAQLLDLLQSQKNIPSPLMGTEYSTNLKIDINGVGGEIHKVQMYEDVAVRVILSKGYVSTCNIIATYEDGVENKTVTFNKSVDPKTSTSNFFEQVIFAPITQNGSLMAIKASCNNGTLTDGSKIIVAASDTEKGLEYKLNNKYLDQAMGAVTEPDAITYCFMSAVNVLKKQTDTLSCVWGGKTIKKITLKDLP